MVVLAASAVVSSNVWSIRDSLFGSALPEPEVPATSRVAGHRRPGPAPEPTALRSAPWWQTVTELEGSGTATSAPFTIDDRAVDWRVSWSCEAGRLEVRAPRSGRPLVDSDCPEGVGHGGPPGSTRLEVAAGGPWRMAVEQRIDLPLVEPPLASMEAPGSRALATGQFRKVDRVGSGQVHIFDTAGGEVLVRLEDFWVTPTSSLQLRLSTSGWPVTTDGYLRSSSQLLSVLDVTAGSLNYRAPAGVGPEGFRSVVIWSPSDDSVYAAAPLEEPA